MAAQAQEKPHWRNPERLSTSELAKMIQRGQQVDECKKEWRYRWKMDFPMYQSAEGPKSYI